VASSQSVYLDIAGDVWYTSGMPESRRDMRALAALLVVLLLWASAFAAIRVAVASYSPGHAALLRFLVASAVVAAYAVITRQPLPERRDWPVIALAGFIGFTVYNVTLNYGEVSVPAGVASLLVATSPIFTGLLAAGVLKEHVSTWRWAGIGLSFAGAAIIALGSSGGNLEVSRDAVLVLVAAITASVYITLMKGLLVKYGALRVTTTAIWSGTLFLLVFTPGLWDAVRSVPLEATLATVFLGIFPGALGYILWSYVLSRLTASGASSYLYLIPPLAILIGWLWLGELPAPAALIGGAMALGGVVIVNTHH
jgi:drug/metabolite transporter (DMT)-like permease